MKMSDKSEKLLRAYTLCGDIVLIHPEAIDRLLVTLGNMKKYYEIENKKASEYVVDD